MIRLLLLAALVVAAVVFGFYVMPWLVFALFGAGWWLITL